MASSGMLFASAALAYGMTMIPRVVSAMAQMLNMLIPSARQPLRQMRSQGGELLRRQSAKDTASLLGNVRHAARAVAEHILLEKCGPGAPGGGRQGADAEDSVQQ